MIIHSLIRRSAVSAINALKTRTPLQRHPINYQTLSRNTSQCSNLVENLQADNQPLLTLSEEDRKDFFRLNDLFTVEDLLEARCHLGHKESLLNEHMRPYIYGKRLGVLIIDLDQTVRLLNKALRVTAEIAYRGGIILFVHGSRQNGWLVERTAQECKEYAFCRRWRNDVLTNSEKTFGAVTRLPDLVVFLSTMDQANSQHNAVVMSAKMLIPTVGICDTNSNPTLITYPVPGNDDTPQSIELYCHLFKEAILRGKSKRAEVVENYGEEFYNKTLESV